MLNMLRGAQRFDITLFLTKPYPLKPVRRAQTKLYFLAENCHVHEEVQHYKKVNRNMFSWGHGVFLFRLEMLSLSPSWLQDEVSRAAEPGKIFLTVKECLSPPLTLFSVL